MFKIQTLNKISPKGLEMLPVQNYQTAIEMADPDGIIVRSYNMLTMDIPDQVKAIARAGTGVNNIPVDACTKSGIIVFNTPGANANSVKELVIASLIFSSRNVFNAIKWVRGRSENGEELSKVVEKSKNDFVGPEIRGKRLGVVGLGAIGVMVANDALALGMEVIGFDPYISIEAAWGLSHSVIRSLSLDNLLRKCDYITIHIPQSDRTKGMFNYEKFSQMKKGVRFLNFARGGLVDTNDLIRAIHEGIVASYITDFPDEKLLTEEAVIPMPHLGASTPEAEDNCAVMAVQQMYDFLEYGTIKNSVNFPDCVLEQSAAKYRISVINRNIPNMVRQVTEVLAEQKINIADMINKHRNEIAYNIIDTDSAITPELLQKIGSIEGVVRVRTLPCGREQG